MASHLHHREADITNSLLLRSIISNHHMVHLRLMVNTTPTSNHHTDTDNHPPGRRRDSTVHPLHSPMVLLPRMPHTTRPGLRSRVTVHRRLTRAVTDNLTAHLISNLTGSHRTHRQRTHPSPTPCSTRQHHLLLVMARR